MEIFNARRVTNIGVLTALYVVLTAMCSSFAYGQVQFRVSEMLILLCFFNKDYIISMFLGCLMVNLFSPMGFMDVVFGTAATVISAVLIYSLRKKSKLFFVSLLPVLFNGVLVGAELSYINGTPFLVNAGWVALGEFVCVSFVGVIVIKAATTNKAFMKLIMSGTDTKTA